MALDSINKEALSFKKLFGKAHTQFGFAAAEEGITSNVQIASSTIFADTINPVPATSGITNLGDTDGVVEKIRFEIDIIPDTLKSTNQSQGYALKLPSGYSGVLSSTYGAGTYLYEALGKLQIVPSLYGELQGDGTTEYDPVLYKADGSTVINRFSPINWNLDRYNGILFIQDPPAAFDISADRPAFIEAYLYVGDYLISGGGGSGERLEKDINQSSHGFGLGDVLTVSGGTYVKALALNSYPEPLGIVTNSITSDKFTLSYIGYTNSLSSVTDDNGNSLSGDTVYYVSDTVAGKLCAIAPVGVDEIVKPILFAITSSEGNILQVRGNVVNSGGTGGGSTSGVTVVNSGGGNEIGVTPNTPTIVELRTIVGSGGTTVDTVNDNIIIQSSKITGGTNGVILLDQNIGLGGTLTGNTVINTNGNGLAIGINGACAQNNSFAAGYSAIATGSSSIALGYYALASAGYSVALGCSQANGGGSLAGAGGLSHGGYSVALNGVACGVASFAAIGGRAYGIRSLAIGNESRACGLDAHSIGNNVEACGNLAFAEGGGVTRVYASGCHAIAMTFNSPSQTAGHGALAHYSAILGGRDHNITSGNTGATIIGGTTIKLTGTTYVNHTAVNNLAIINEPTIGNSLDDVLVRDENSGIIKRVSSTVLGQNNNILNITGVTTYTANTENYLILVQTSGSSQTVTLPATPSDGVSFIIKDKGNAGTNNITIDGNGINIEGISTALINTDYGSIGLAYSSDDNEWYVISLVG